MQHPFILSFIPSPFLSDSSGGLGHGVQEKDRPLSLTLIGWSTTILYVYFYNNRPRFLLPPLLRTFAGGTVPSITNALLRVSVLLPVILRYFTIISSKDVNARTMSACFSKVQRRLAVRVSDTGICTSLKQQLHHRCLSLPCCLT